MDFSVYSNNIYEEQVSLTNTSFLLIFITFVLYFELHPEMKP